MSDDRAFAAAQSFLLAAKSYWTTQMYPALRREYETRAARAPERPQSVADVAKLMGDSTLYRYFAWLERHLQRFKYSGRYGLQHWHARDRERLSAELEHASGIAADLLALDSKLPLPRYYTSVDIHQHPGGVWSDPLAGLVYERGARSTTPLAADRHRDLHQRLTDLALREVPAPGRVLDMACGFGKSTRPFYEALPSAEIEAIDLAAPCLAVAARDASAARARNVRFRQMDAQATSYPDASFDLVTSTMFLHELPPPAIERALAEAARVLKPGGKIVHLDFLPQVQPHAQGAPNEAFARFVHYGHGRRNNEPFMEPLAEMDLRATLERAGFTNVRFEPFAEADGALDPAYPNWRFPWAAIVAERGTVGASTPSASSKIAAATSSRQERNA